MSTQDISVGDLVRLDATFTDNAGAEVDPTAVYFQTKNRSGSKSTYEYGVDANVVKVETGVYYADIDATQSGTWWYRVYSTGTGQAADESSFEVAYSEFTG
jgi:hypothetical protein